MPDTQARGVVQPRERDGLPWQPQQRGVAKLFRSLGCEAEPEVTVRGARSQHRVDVLVTFNLFGQRVSWVVECKSTKRRISKDKVLALQKVVEDLGADRGILVSTRGFQPAALAAASNSNITLTSPPDLARAAGEQLYSRRLDEVDRRLFELEPRLVNLRVVEVAHPGSVTMRMKPGVDVKGFMRFSVGVSLLSQGLRNARAGRFPILVGFEEDLERAIAVGNGEDYLRFADRTISDVRKWLGVQESQVKPESTDRARRTRTG